MVREDKIRRSVESVQSWERPGVESCYVQKMLMTRTKLATALVATFVATTALHAQSLAGVAKKTEDERTKTEPAKVITNADLKPGPEVSTEPSTFTPTKDNIFVCKARSLKALFKAVDSEHRGNLTEQFANLKLRDDPDLAAAAKADSASCEKGSYIGAMEKALKAEADDVERLRGLLKGK
jgi:hypothetical protein